MGFFRNTMNNFYYGKSGKADFTPESLPTSRMQLFWEMLRVRFSGLMRLNLLYAVAWLPAMILLLLYALSAVTLLTQTENLAEAATQLKQTTSTTLLILFPCIAITGPFTAGISYVTRNWARDEHAFIWGDFKDAVKSNWKQSLPVSAVTGLMPLLFWVCWNYYGSMSGALGLILQALIFMVTAIASMMMLYIHPMIVTYQLSLKDILRNALILSMAKAPQSLGIRLLHCIPCIAAVVCYLYVSPIWTLLVIFLYYLFFGFGLSRFVTASFTNAVFDQYINSKIEGAKVNRGLAEKTDDDDEDDEDEEDEESASPERLTD